MRLLPRLSALAALLFPAVAVAQVPRAPALADFGTCVARQHGAVARALLATEVGSRDEQRLASQLFHAAGRACYGGFGGFSARVGEVRGIAAEALLEADATAPARLSARPATAPVRVTGQLDGRAFVLAYAACLADAEPAKSVALLATPHRSQAELDAFMAYGETLNDCMQEGATYRVDRFDVRNHIAAHLYRAAMTAGGRPDA